jgi:hypothetical protein
VMAKGQEYTILSADNEGGGGETDWESWIRTQDHEADQEGRSQDAAVTLVPRNDLQSVGGSEFSDGKGARVKERQTLC